jgi:hypothetical protein
MKRMTLIALLLVVAACGTDETNNGAADAGDDLRTGADTSPNSGNNESDAADNSGNPMDAGDDMSPDEDAGPDMSMASCNREPAPANRPRKVVVAHPFADTVYEVFDLDESGNLTRPGVTFDMGRGGEATIQFTPDGEFGYAVQDDGTIGVFRFDSNGNPEVLATNFDPGFYVTGALIDEAGDFLYAWESGFRIIDMETHGAMYRLPLDCASGMPGEPKDVYAAGKLIRGADWLSPDRMAVAAVDLLDDETPNDIHLMDIAGPSRVASVQVFEDEDSITGGFALTADGQYALIGDTSGFASEPNSVRVGAVFGDSLMALPGQTFEIFDPQRIVTSPFDNAVIVVATMDDAIYVLDYNRGANASPFAIRAGSDHTDADGKLQTDDATLLPLGVAMIERGDLEGMVFVGENVGVRQLQFETDGTVTDLGLLGLGMGTENITGAVGVQP